MITIKNPKILKWLKYVLSAILSLIILVIIIGGLLFTFYISSAPKLSEAQLKSTNSSLVYDGNNNLIADLGSEKRENVTADSIPINLVNAITSIEDKRFFNHRGVDLYRIFGAAFHNLTSQTTQGGSTLDQQLIKLAYFSTNESDQTLKRKAQEVWLALQMERKYTKQEILTFYINKVYMGNGNYGMLTAAKSYYGKDLKDLSYAQLALLAGIPQAPSQYDPYLHPEAAQNRRNVVLQQMYMEKHLTKAEYETAIATPVAEGLQSLQQRSIYPKYMDNYLKQVIEEVKKETNKDIFTAGLKVYTNIIPDAQQTLYNIYHSGDYVYYPDQDFQVASTIVDVTNGHVIAQLGGRNQDENVSFGTNQAVLTDRDWGSTMKPITAYAPAIESGVYTSTAQSTNDSVYYWPGTTTQLFNWDLRYNGWMTIQAAIMLSRNVPAVRALEAAGLDYARSFLSSLGINYPEMHYSNAISSNNSSSDKKYGASSEKMAAAYAAFANGGIYHKPRYVNKVEFSDGTSKTFDEKGKRAMKETTAYMMTDMLKTVLTYGTGTAAAIPGVAQAGKTGTSNYTDEELAKIGEKYGLYPDYVGTLAPDENFVGFTKRYAMAVWTGYKNRLTPVYGSSLEIASDVYRSMMTYLTNGYSEDWTMPNGLYRSGGFLYLSGTYASNTDYTNSVYNNLYSNNTTTASSQTTSDDTSSSNDTSNSSNSTNTDNNGSHPSTDDKKTTH
ncbi:penicillin-binding protein PBP1A [Streptococcus pyogenes]|uniref:penicillin-binding protein PBP1A n=1 Tax=Streptococcus pyogenes TaxID=1314 RepID=UPI0003583747|nr:penicillin-binding protein PBP1A [Streptococcus pyogenes]HER4795659.1 penicillin-binding protein [Streptococcus pyogenes NGAS128]AGQ27988.1 penicillin-binding protein 1A [Streptococcus pyogenes HSC5]OLO16130.1 penicillin-binding protein [Streptococcus pyogenes]SUO54759.1 penicillin-binding protein 1A [Streptococcus pyogenes]HEP1268806.1 penicillin-binding protein [Streptococcus pyogenes]